MAKKKININDPKAWREIGLDDTPGPELLKRTDRIVNSSRANRLKANDPTVKKKLVQAQKRILTNPDNIKIRREAAQRGGNTKANSIEYQQLMTKVNQKKAEKPEFAENVRKGILKKLEDPVYIAARKEGNKKKYKPIQDPNGKTWPSRKDAAQAWNIIPQTISKLVKKLNSGWKYV